MRILVANDSKTAFQYISQGWINALLDKGHAVKRWNSDMQTWHRFKPQLYIGTSAPKHRQPIPNDLNCLKVIHVNPFGPHAMRNVDEKSTDRKWVMSIKPDLVVGHGFQDDYVYWSFWKEKFGLEWCPMPTGADATIFNIKNSLSDRTLDVGYLGGRWSHKSSSIDEYLFPILRNENYSTKLFGWGDWPAHFGVVKLSNQKVPKFYNNIKIAPCISEKHTRNYGIDIPERVWKSAACGALPIHDPVPTLARIFPELPMAQSAKEYSEKIDYFLNKDHQRIVLSQTISEKVLSEHTYHNRLAVMFEKLGLDSESKHMLSS